jgi:hypothetical protein
MKTLVDDRKQGTSASGAPCPLVDVVFLDPTFSQVHTRRASVGLSDQHIAKGTIAL